MFEADDGNGHDNHGGAISHWGTPWTHNRALNAELAQAQSVAKVLSDRYGKRVLVIRVNSDNGSKRMPENDFGCHTRAKMVADIINKVEDDQTPFPQNSFRFSLVDMPERRKQPGTLISTSTHAHEVFISWLNIQQTIIPTTKDFRDNLNKMKREAQKERRDNRKREQ